MTSQAGYTPPQSTNVGAGLDRPANNKFGITAQPRKSASDILGNVGQSGAALTGYKPAKSAVSGQSAVTGLAPIRDTRTANLSPTRNTRTINPAPAQSPRADTPAANIRFNAGFAQQNFVNSLANPAKSGILKQETVDDYQSASAAARAAYLMPLQSPAAVEDDAGNSNRDDQPARLQEAQAYIKQKRIDAMTDKAAVQSQWDAMKQQAQTYDAWFPDRWTLNAQRMSTKEIESTANALDQMFSLMRGRTKNEWNALAYELRQRPDMFAVIAGSLTSKDWVKQELKRQTVLQQGYPEDGMRSAQPFISRVANSNINVMYAPAFNDAPGTQDPTGFYVSQFQGKEVPVYDTEWVPIFSPGNLPSVDFAGNHIDEQVLSLSPELQKATYEMCKMAGVDYLLVLSIVAHESSSTPTASNTSGAKGLMQFIDKNWWAYNADPGDDAGHEGQINYYDRDSIISQLQEYAHDFDSSAQFTADKECLYNPVTAIAIGIAALYEQQYAFEKTGASFKEHGVSVPVSAENQQDYFMYYVVTKYGNGVDMSAAYEILYYRDLLAQAAGQPTWYMGDLYDQNGKDLKVLHPLR